jgi:lysylphosphatidylglycerol synthetase-like protein (DUF2156 family)
MRLNRWQTATLTALQLLFAACATSVLVYRARGWAPEVFDFGWLSYRALNIYVSLAVIGYLVWGLLRGYRHVLALLAIFSLFHLVEGVIIGFLSKAVIHLMTLLMLAWIVLKKSARRLPKSSIARERGEIGAAE